MYRELCRRLGQALAIIALTLGMAMCSLSHAGLPPPAVVWWSAPVMPGEIAVLHGGLGRRSQGGDSIDPRRRAVRGGYGAYARHR